MVVDSSALIAILTKKPHSGEYLQAIVSAEFAFISVANYPEVVIVRLSKGGLQNKQDLDGLLEDLEIERIAVSPGHADLAADSSARFGKGRHPAELNVGDCFAYARAKALDAPLLDKGADFAATDIAPAAVARS